MSETLILLAAFIAAMALWLAAFWLFGCVGFDDGDGEPVLTAKPKPRRVRAGQPPADLEASGQAGIAAAYADFDGGGLTPNPEIHHSPAFARWSLEYAKTTEVLINQTADSMLSPR